MHSYIIYVSRQSQPHVYLMMEDTRFGNTSSATLQRTSAITQPSPSVKRSSVNATCSKVTGHRRQREYHTMSNTLKHSKARTLLCPPNHALIHSKSHSLIHQKSSTLTLSRSHTLNRHHSHSSSTRDSVLKTKRCRSLDNVPVGSSSIPDEKNNTLKTDLNAAVATNIFQQYGDAKEGMVAITKLAASETCERYV